MKRLICSAVAVAMLVTASAPRSRVPQELGTITFPTSGAPAAQAAFLEGVKSLHSFQFDEAAVAFQRAQKIDPTFAMAYWGEAMSHNHPLWAQQDTKAAQAILQKIAPTLKERLAKAKLPKEKAFLGAIDVLYNSPGEKLARDNAYSEALAAMYALWPDDHEVATWYALSLLGTVRPTDRGFRRQALAASIAEKVFAENPKHPGAAHFIIHAFDDPDHAPLALPAARSYAGIAPSAAHALHMPSHIFVQRGMWDDVRTSNIVAYKAATELNARMKLRRGPRRLPHARLAAVREPDAGQHRRGEAERRDRRSRPPIAMPTNAGIRNGYLGMRARLILETEKWEKIALDAPGRLPTGGRRSPHMPACRAWRCPRGSNTWIFIAGYSAAKLGDLKTAEAAEAHLRRRAREARSRRRIPISAKPDRDHGKAGRRADLAFGAGTEGRRPETRQGSDGDRAVDVGAFGSAGPDQAGAGVLRRAAD